MYRKHVFVCENSRVSGKCCNTAAGAINKDGSGAVKILRQQLKAAGAHGKGQVRVNRAGCFDRCEEGPVLVIYPCGRWYRYATVADLQAIVENDILNDRPVARLQLQD